MRRPPRRSRVGRISTLGIAVVVACGRNGRGKGKRTVSGRIPLPGVSTCGRTGSRRFHRSGVIAGCQFRHRHRGGSLTTGAGTRQRTGGTGGGVLSCLVIGVVVTQLGNALGLGTGAVITSVSLGTGGSTSGSLGDGAAVPAVGTSTPSTVVTVPPAGLHGIHAAGVGRNRQVGGLVPLISPVIGSISAVHSAENNVAITRRDITNIDIVALGGHTDPFVGRFILEKIRSKTGTVGLPFAVDLQNQLGGGSRLCFCRSHHAEDDTNRADQQQDTKKLDHFPLHRVPPVFLHTPNDKNQPIFTIRLRFRVIIPEPPKKVYYFLQFLKDFRPHFPSFFISSRKTAQKQPLIFQFFTNVS